MTKDISELVMSMLPPTRHIRYPHMFPQDIAIWERFLDKHGHEFLGFIYDAKVGSGTEPLPDMHHPYDKMQLHLSKYRIDVIGVKNDRLEILEVKPSAATSAVGQVMSYHKLFLKDYTTPLKVVSGIVTDFERPDMRELTMHFGLKYYIV